MPLAGDAGAARWVRRHWRAVAAELLATALLVLLGVAALLPRRQPREQGREELLPAPLLHPALAFGFLVTCLAEVFGGVSGAHMNPAVTLAAAAARRLPPALAAAYVAAQLLGAVLGFAALQALCPALVDGQGLTLPAPAVGALAAAGVEALLTGTLALLACAAWARADPDPAGSVKFGLTVAGLIFAGGELTGASLNPARSLAPALLQARWEHHWVYWAGPLGGAALAALLHRFVLAPHAYAARPGRPGSAPPAPGAPEQLPLADKLEQC